MKALGASTGPEPTGRLAELPALANQLGRAWAEEVRDAFTKEGRAIADGWPGTISEARSRIASALARGSIRDRLGASEVAELVRGTYGAARAVWRIWTPR